MRKKVFLSSGGAASVRQNRLLGRLRGLPAGTAVAAAAGVLHTVVLPGGLSPVALSLLIGVPQRYVVFAALGYYAGAWLAGQAVGGVYLSAAGILLAVRFICGLKNPRADRAIWRSSLIGALASLLLSKLAVSVLLSAVSLWTILADLAECAVIAVLAAFWRAFFCCLKASRSDIYSLAASGVCLALIAAGLYSIDIGYLSLGRLGIAFAVLAFCYRLEPQCALAWSIFLCAAMVVAEPACGFAAAGLLCGAAVGCFCSGLPRLPAGLPVMLPAALFAVFAPNEMYAYTYLSELGAASALYLVLPLGAPRQAGETAPLGAVRFIRAGKRLETAAASLRRAANEVRNGCTVDAAAHSAPKIINEAANEVCRTCPNMGVCWVQAYDDTVQDMASLLRVADVRGRPTASDMPARLAARCVRPQKLLTSFHARYRSGLARVTEDRNVRAYRRQLTGSFELFASLLGRTAQSVVLFPDSADTKAAELYSAALAARLPVRTVELARAENGVVAVEMTFDSELNTRGRMALEKLLTRRMEMPFAMDSRDPGSRRAVFVRQSRYTASITAFQRARNRLTADIWTSFDTDFGYTYLLLADGMGTGPEAAGDSACICALARSLLEAGADARAAAIWLNSVLSIRAAAEEATSIDLLELNRYTGEAKLFKAGGAPTCFCCGGQTESVSGPSLPIGILDELCCYDCSRTLQKGDTVCLISDGAWAACGDGLRARIEQMKDAAALRDELARLMGDVTADDVTVLLLEVS